MCSKRISGGEIQAPAECCHSLAVEQAKDPVVRELMEFVQQGWLPQDDDRARKMALQQSLFTVVYGVLYFLDPKRGNCKRAAVPKDVQQKILHTMDLLGVISLGRGCSTRW